MRTTRAPGRAVSRAVDERRADDPARQGDHAGLGGQDATSPAIRRWATG